VVRPCIASSSRTTAVRGYRPGMGLLDALRDRRLRRRERARQDAERKAQAQGKLNDEVIADGDRAAEHPPKPGELSPWER
jgi:hypothetical protein